MHRGGAFIVTGLLALVLCLQGSPAAQQQPTFRAKQTVVVALFVTVTDAEQRLATDLTEDEFEVYDNDKLQSLVVFDNKPRPINVVVMLDTSGSMVNNLTIMKDAAEQFMLRLFPGDKAKVGAFNDKIQIMRDFSSDRDALVSEVRRIDFGNGTHLWDAAMESLVALKDVDGRRVVVLFTDGVDEGGHLGIGPVLDRARADEAMAYGIGFESEYGSGPGRVHTKPDGGLKKLAEETGGGYFQLDKSAALGATFSRVAQELHSQYTLGFSPTVLDNKTHKLTVKLKKPGMTARARRNYVAKG